MTFQELVSSLEGELSKASIHRLLKTGIKWKEIIFVDIDVFGSDIRFYGMANRKK